MKKQIAVLCTVLLCGLRGVCTHGAGRGPGAVGHGGVLHH